MAVRGPRASGPSRSRSRRAAHEPGAGPREHSRRRPATPRARPVDPRMIAIRKHIHRALVVCMPPSRPELLLEMVAESGKLGPRNIHCMAAKQARPEARRHPRQNGARYADRLSLGPRGRDNLVYNHARRDIRCTAALLWR
eukprot:6844133-Prymnesium_polylepis.1